MSARKILAIGGADRTHFLQGLISNDIEKAAPGLIYAALLSPQGKYLADFFVTEHRESFLIDADAAQAPALAQRLSMYKLRADVTISESPLHVSRGTGPAPDGALADPRDPHLGWRLYSAEPLPDDGTDWDALRVAHLIPEAGIELIANDSFLLEMGFERLSGVDFRKGCYVGQEVTARMKHKTELRKGLARVEIEGTCPVGTQIIAGGKAAGQIFTQSGGQALAYLRFDRAKGDMQAGQATVRYTAA